MKSTKQARPTSTPKKITLEGGIKLQVPQASGRASPASKTAATIFPQSGFKSATG
jgi:hypothetical protein